MSNNELGFLFVVVVLLLNLHVVAFDKVDDKTGLKKECIAVFLKDGMKLNGNYSAPQFSVSVTP